MANEDIGSLVVRIEANMQNFMDGADKFDKGLSTMKKAAIGLGAVIGAGALFKGFIDDASEAEDNLKQLQTVIESTGGKAGVTADQVTSMASELQKVTKFSDDAVISGSNLLLTFTSIGKDVFPAATETMLNMSQALGQDVKSSAIQLGKALNDPIKGITALSRVGVSFTDEQKEQIKTLQESGDMVGAQTIILKELETEFGNAAKAAGETFSGKMERLKNQFGEIKESIGGALLPVLSNLAGMFLEKLPQAMQIASDAYGFFIDGFNGEGDPKALLGHWEYWIYKIGEVAGKIFTAARDSFYFFIDGIKGAGDPEALLGTWYYWVYKLGEVAKVAFTAFGKAVEFAVNNMNLLIPIMAGVISGIVAFQIISKINALMVAWAALTAGQTTLMSVLNAVMRANPIGLIATAIGLLIAAGILLYQNWDTVKEKASKLWDNLKSAFPILDLITTGFFAIVDAVKSAIEWIDKFNGKNISSKNVETDVGNYKLQRRASGGPVFAGKSYLVGEDRPEIFVPSTNGTIIPNTNALSGQSINMADMFRGAVFNVRSDNDAKLIAREVYNLQVANYRGAGVPV